MKTQLVKPCEICGDVGYYETIMTCTTCSTRQHPYCLPKATLIYPEVWTCEECTSSYDISLQRYGGKEGLKNYSGTFEFNKKKGIREAFDDSIGNSHFKKPKTGKVKFLAIEEVLRLHSGTSRTQSLLKTNSGSRHGSSNLTPKHSYPKPNPRIVPAHLTTPASGTTQLTRVTTPQVPQMVKVRSSPITSEKERRSKEHQRTDSSMSKDIKIYDLTVPVKEVESCSANAKKATSSTSCTCSELVHGTVIDKVRSSPITPEKECRRKEHQRTDSSLSKGVKIYDLTVPTKEVESCSAKAKKATSNTSCMCSELVHGTMSNKGSNSSTNTKNLDLNQGDLLPILPKLHDHGSCFPARHATWKGGFKFCHDAMLDQFYGGFQAQPSSVVHRKAYNFSLKMPGVLQVQLLPRQPVLIDLFHNDYPELHDIALYFFSCSGVERSEEILATLFELMEMKNSVMLSCIDDVELLIFTSKQLHLDSHTIMARSSLKHFLWGVFRHAKSRPLVPKMLEGQSSIPSPVGYNESEGSNSDAELQKLRKVSYNAETGTSYVPPEVARRINPPTLPSADHLQNSLGSLSEATEDGNLPPPGFEDRARPIFRR